MTYVSAGIGFCFLTQFGRYAKIVRKELGVYGVIQDTYFSAARDGAPPTAGAVETHVHLESGEDEKFGQEILGMAEQTCFSARVEPRQGAGERPASPFAREPPDLNPRSTGAPDCR